MRRGSFFACCGRDERGSRNVVVTSKCFLDPLETMTSPSKPEPGKVELELGTDVPIPGVIRPEAEWARTAIKRLPPPGPVDWTAIFGREAPVVLELGCG